MQDPSHIGVRCKTAVGAMLSDFKTLGLVRVSTFELLNPYLVRSSRRSAGMVARDILKPSEVVWNGGIPPGVIGVAGSSENLVNEGLRRLRRPEGHGVLVTQGLERPDRITERHGGAVIKELDM